MSQPLDFQYFQGNSFSDLFAQDILNTRSAFLLNYPATASWAAYPNTRKYFIQDGSSETTKTSFDKICQKEPWKNLAVLGDLLPGIVITPVPEDLLGYWKDYFGFRYDNLETFHCSVYLDKLNQSDRIDQVITLFPFDHLQPDKHAVNPDFHYRLLSKVALADFGVPCPAYESYNLHHTKLSEIPLPEQFPYLIKTSHGLSGEGTYIIQNSSDLRYCLTEVKKYLEINLLDTIIVSEFVPNVVQNYCVQFYVNKTGAITLVGTTGQLVTPDGNYLGGVIHYQETEVSRFFELIAAIGHHAHNQGYFGFIGFDVLEDRDGQFYVIDANFRVNGSTPLCLQRHTLLGLGKEVAKYSSSYQMDGTLDRVMATLKPELERRDLLILSALERGKYGKIYTEIYGIVAGETLSDLQRIEQTLQQKGLQL